MLEVLREHSIIQSDRHRATPWRGPNWFFTAPQPPIYYRDMKYSCLMTHLGHSVYKSSGWLLVEVQGVPDSLWFHL